MIGALTASRPGETRFPAGAEVRLTSFADLAAQAIANERAQAELRASRARIVRTADETRRRLERNLHDGAQQRLVSTSLTLRLATARLPPSAEAARLLLEEASEELTRALEELRELARGLHPAILTDRGFEPALGALTARTSLPVTVACELDDPLTAPVEAALYYLVSECLTNVAKHAAASNVTVRALSSDNVARTEVTDDGVGGADIAGGTGLARSRRPDRVPRGNLRRRERSG